MAAVALVLALALAGTALTLWRLHAGAIDNGSRHAEIVTRSVEDYLTQNLHAVEMMVSTSLPFDPAADAKSIERIFGDSLRQRPQLRSLSLLTEDGRVIASSNPANRGTSLRLNEFFPATNIQTELLRIGPPRRGRDLANANPAELSAPLPADAVMHIPVLRSFSAGGRRLLLVAAINPDSLLTYIEHLLPQAQGRLAIVRYDGVVLVSSDPQQQPGTTDTPLVNAMNGGKNELGRLNPDATDDGQLSAFRTSRLYPAVVVTRLDRAVVLEAWREESASILVLLGPMLALLVAVASLLYRRQLRALTERQEAAQVQKLHATVFDSSLDAIIITDHRGNIVAVNPSFTEISGYSAEEVLGRNPRLLSSGRHDAEFYRQLWQELTERGVWRGEILNRRKDGSLYNARTTITSVHDAGDTLLHYIGIASDVTEQRLQDARIEDLNRDLARRAEDAEAASRAKTAFLSNMSHELRTPLNHIVGFTAILQKNLAAPRATEWLGRIEQSSQHLLHLIETVLDVSRIESGRFELEPIDFSLKQMLEEVEGVARRKADAKGLALQATYAADLPLLVHADPTQIAQLIGQLLDNAVKFTTKGSIALRVWTAVGVEYSTFLHIEIEDQGIGISAEKMDGLFTLFHQGDNSQTRQYGGTGIGLALCKRLCDLMGGSLDIQCSEDSGCLVHLTLPVHLPQPAAASGA